MPAAEYLTIPAAELTPLALMWLMKSSHGSRLMVVPAQAINGRGYHWVT